MRSHADSVVRVLVSLYFNQVHKHLLTELNTYADLAPEGSYCLESYTVIEGLPVRPLPFSVEALPNEEHLSIPTQRADLRTWLERKFAADGLHPGETLRRDLVKLTPLGLLRLLDGTTKARKPEAVLKSLSQQPDQPEWIETARQQWTLSTSWVDTINTFGSIVSLSEAIARLLPLACIA